MDLYVAAPTDPHFVRRLKEVSGQWTVSDWSPDETRIVAVEYISINESYIHIIEVATGKTETITPRPGTPRPSGLRQRSEVVEGREIDLLPDRPGTRVPRLVATISFGGRRGVEPQVPRDIEEFDLSEDGKSSHGSRI